jgi:hypothetical protein
VLNKSKGTAKIKVEVPGAGRLKLTGKNVKSVGKEVDGGSETLTVKPSGKAKNKLESTGRVRVAVRITFTPTGGEPNSVSRKLTLKQRQGSTRRFQTGATGIEQRRQCGIQLGRVDLEANPAALDRVRVRCRSSARMWLESSTLLPSSRNRSTYSWNTASISAPRPDVGSSSTSRSTSQASAAARATFWRFLLE